MTQKSTMPERVGAREPLPLETWLAVERMSADIYRAATHEEFMALYRTRLAECI